LELLKQNPHSTDPGKIKVDPFFANLLPCGKYSPTTGMLKLSNLATRHRELMSLYYVPFESHFLLHSTRKALRMDSFDPDSEEKTSSCIEDAFFVFKKVVMRAIGTHYVDALCALLNVSVRAMETEYLKEGLQQKLVTAFGGERAPALSERSDAKVGYMVRNVISLYCVSFMTSIY
jgi:hypothetical protein